MTRLTSLGVEESEPSSEDPEDSGLLP
jgi:hypothetical protein